MKGDGKGKSRFKIRDLFADEQCTRPILDFLRTTEVGRRTGGARGDTGRGPVYGAGQRKRGRERGLSGEPRMMGFLSLSFFLSFVLCFVYFLCSGDEPGGGRGSCRLPSVDWPRSGRTANGIGLYIISP
jgi:hypothetical protein